MHVRPALLVQGFSNVGHCLAHLLTLLYPTIVLVLQAEWRMSYGELIGLMLAGQILFGAAALPAGWLGDRWSTLGMMVVFFLGTGLAAIATGFARDGVELALGLAGVGLFAAIYHPVGMAWLVRNSENQGRALGWNGSFGAIGLALAPLVAGFLADLWSWRAAFIVPGLITTLLGALLALAWTLGWVSDSAPTITRRTRSPSRADVIRVFFILSVTMICAGLIGQCFTVILPKLFADRIGGTASAAGVGMLVTIVYLCAAAAQPVGGWLADRFPMRRVYLVAFILLAPVLFIASSLSSWPLVALSIILVFIQITASPAENKLLAHYTPGGWQGTAYGAKFVLALGVSASAIPGIGWIYDATGGFYWLFVIMGLLAVIGMLGAAMLPGPEKPAAIAGARRAPQPAE